MPSTHISLHYHLVFSTKNREPWILPAQRHRVHEYLGGVIRHINGFLMPWVAQEIMFICRSA